MEINELLDKELKGSFDFFLKYTNLDPDSTGYGLTVDSTKTPNLASIASVGFALTAWVIAVDRGYIDKEKAQQITRGTLLTLLNHVADYRGFFAHFVAMKSGMRHRQCEYSTIDTALCLNGIITAAAYFQDDEIISLAQAIIDRVDWNYIVFTREEKTLFHMAYNPDRHGDYSNGNSGFISQWDMAAEQKMMYFQAAAIMDPLLGKALYQGFSRDTGYYDGQPVIVNPGGNLFAYQFSEAWFDAAQYVDPDGIDWFNNTRLAALANRNFCIENADRYKSYHADSWGISCGDSPTGYAVFGSTPCLESPRHNGTVTISAALACLPFIPGPTKDLAAYLYRVHPKTWGPYGFYDAYNLDISPDWYSHAIYGINKGCSMIMIANYLNGLIWDVYTSSPIIQAGLKNLGFVRRTGDKHEQLLHEERSILVE